MTGTNASLFTPLTVGQSDSGDFSAWLGRPVQYEDETYTAVTASVAIASGSNGKQLQTIISSGQATFVVTLATGGVSAYLNCGAIPWTHTGPIAAGASFLALRDSRGHVLLVRGTATGALVANQPVVAGTGADLINVFTGSAIAALTGEAATSSGIGALLDRHTNRAGVTLIADTGVAAVSGWVQYRAPFRGAD
jgi:hypothetical protein